MQNAANRPSIRALAQTAKSRRLATLTAYDYPTGRIADDCGLDFILVGDSLGMVALGFEDTTWVTMEHMLHHTAAVSRAVSKTPIVSDLPYESYLTPSEALANARRLINAGADAIKLEGADDVMPQIEAISSAGISFIGHLGMLPQHVREEGGYKKKGKSPEQAEELIKSAQSLENAGASAIILESVVTGTADAITNSISIPTIGIGCGEGSCDGEVAVISDVVGSYPWFVPPFAETHGNVAGDIKSSIEAYINRVTA